MDGDGLLCDGDRSKGDLRAAVFLEVPGLLPAERQTCTDTAGGPGSRDAWGEVPAGGSRRRVEEGGGGGGAFGDGGGGVLVGTPTGQAVGCSGTAGGRCSDFEGETSAPLGAVACMAKMGPRRAVVFADPEAALQSLISDTPD